jgi:hypothetical protein
MASFEVSEPIPFSGADSIFSSGCGAISGRLRFAGRHSLAAIPATETLRFKRPTIGSALSVGTGTNIERLRSFGKKNLLSGLEQAAVRPTHSGGRRTAYADASMNSVFRKEETALSIGDRPAERSLAIVDVFMRAWARLCAFMSIAARRGE